MCIIMVAAYVGLMCMFTREEALCLLACMWHTCYLMLHDPYSAACWRLTRSMIACLQHPLWLRFSCSCLSLQPLSCRALFMPYSTMRWGLTQAIFSNADLLWNGCDALQDVSGSGFSVSYCFALALTMPIVAFTGYVACGPMTGNTHQAEQLRCQAKGLSSPATESVPGFCL